jgi:hypothetical protein
MSQYHRTEWLGTFWTPRRNRSGAKIVNGATRSSDNNDASQLEHCKLFNDLAANVRA